MVLNVGCFVMCIATITPEDGRVADETRLLAVAEFSDAGEGLNSEGGFFLYISRVTWLNLTIELPQASVGFPSDRLPSKVHFWPLFNF